MTLAEFQRPGAEALGLARWFFHWWRTELAALVPRSLTGGGETTRPKLVLAVEGTELVGYRCAGNAASELARRSCEPWDEPEPAFAVVLRQTRDPVVLRLPAQHVLRRTVALPEAARDNLREVLGFEMDRQTPFSVEDVYYDFAVLETGRPDSQLLVDLVVAPRRTVDKWVRRLQKLGVRITQVTAENPGERSGLCGGLNVNLMPSQAPAKRAGRAYKRVNAVLASVAAVLAVIALALPLFKMHGVQTRLQAAVTTAQSEAEEVSALREALQADVRYAEVVAERKQATPPMIELLADLARTLPDDTWLSAVNVQGGTLNIHGESKTASQLIGLLESSPLLAEPAFVSPVIPNPVTGYERFQIAVTLSPGGS